MFPTERDPNHSNLATEVAMATNQNTSIEHELVELADEIQALLFLSEGSVTHAQLDDYSEQFTHLLRYGRALGYHAAFSVGEDSGMAVEWIPIFETDRPS
jgi:hypothetical protein